MNTPEGGRPLNVVLIHAADAGGGAERSTLSLHLELIKQGHNSRMYVGYKRTNSPNVVEIERVRTIPGVMRVCRWLEENRGWQHLYAPGFRRLHSIIPPDTDILHIHSLWASGGFADVGALPALTRQFPTLITLREQWLTTGHCANSGDCDRWLRGCGSCPHLDVIPVIAHDGTRINWLRKWIALHRSQAHITTVSDWMREMAMKSPILAGKTISTIYNGIDVSVFSPGSQDQAREALNIPKDKFSVLLAGQSIEGIHHGIAQHAISAFNRFKSDGFLPLLVGHSASLVAKTLSIPCRVLPFQETPQEMARCYRASDLTVVCSEVESFGRIAAESQACGTPVLAFASGGLPEVVKHGMGGWLVPTGDVDALTAGLRFFIENSSERRRMGSAGATWVQTQFSNEKVTKDFISLYGQVITKRRRLER